MSHPVAVLVDFDGTASLRDVGYGLIERFARDDSWQVIDNDYENGRIGSRQAYRLLGRVLRGTPEEWLEAALQRVQLDPGLAPLVAGCRERGWWVEVLSDGWEFYIQPALARARLEVPVRANRLQTGGGSPLVLTPHLNPLCGRCGTCKRERVGWLRERGAQVVYVGDGYSDFCAAPRADRVFAKGTLAAHLTDRGIPFEPFTTLLDVARALAL